MMRRRRDGGLFVFVLATAVLLAVVILYFGARRLVRRGLTAGRRPAAATRSRSARTETPPSFLPPIKLDRIERRPPAKRGVVGTVPEPPVGAGGKSGS